VNSAKAVAREHEESPLSNVLEVLHQYTPLLTCLDRMTDALRDIPGIGDEAHPVYAIKGRVKTHSSIMEKLTRIADSKTDSNARTAGECIRNNHVTWLQLCTMIDDLIGCRVVCLFKEDVYRILNKFLDGKSTAWFDTTRLPSGQLRIACYRFMEDETPPAIADYANAKRSR
jgi:ppGpp synthetase/RelA/SpoT-type nucleotidyltranferase